MAMRKRVEIDKIYHAAQKIFARYGFKRTRMEDVAQELGLATATLYNYVKDKNDLYERAVAAGIRRWQGLVFQAVAEESDIRAKFLAMCQKGYEYLRGDQDLRTIMIHDPTVFPLSPRKVRFPDIDRASIGMIKDVLQTGISQGVFRPVDVDSVAELLYSIYVMFIIKRYVVSEGQSTSKMYQDGLDLILEGLLARDTTTEIK